jgi:hypothetical protein
MQIMPRELGPKAPDGIRFAFGTWELHTCVDTRTDKRIQRPKREGTHTSGKQAVLPASESEAVLNKVHKLGRHKVQERTWKDIAGGYHEISQDLGRCR